MDTQSLGMDSGGFEIFRALISLIVVLGMVFVAYYWMKRRGTVLGTSSRRMRIVERLPIDGRRSILLLQVDGQEMVLAVGTDSIAPIQTLGKGAADEE